MKYDLTIDGQRHSADFVRPTGASSQLVVKIDDREIVCDAKEISTGLYSILIGGRSIEVSVENTPTAFVARTRNHSFQFEIRDPRAWRGARGGGVALEGRQQLVAPMSGKVVRTLVSQGQVVEAGQGVLVVEAMKMQNEIRSPKAGTVEQLLVKEGQTVNSGELLAVVS